MKRAFLIHGWGGSPKDAWFPWLEAELEKRGFRVFAPAMPDTEHPDIEAWVSSLAGLVGEPDEETFFVGHSIGCQAILRYLERLPKEKKVGGAVFVAGWFALQNLPDEEWSTAGPWLKTPLDMEKIRQHTSKFVGIFSDNDPVVPPENRAMFEERLGAKVVVEHGKGHLDEEEELLSVLEATLKMAA